MTCGCCYVTKPATEFYPYNKQCKACLIAKSQKLHSGKRYILKKYGLTLADYEMLLMAQGFVCAICYAPHKDTPSKKWGRARLAVDHDHQTGEVRGLLCANCNRLLGLAGDSTEILRRSIAYLENPPAPAVLDV